MSSTFTVLALLVSSLIISSCHSYAVIQNTTLHALDRRADGSNRETTQRPPHPQFPCGKYDVIISPDEPVLSFGTHGSVFKGKVKVRQQVQRKEAASARTKREAGFTPVAVKVTREIIGSEHSQWESAIHGNEFMEKYYSNEDHLMAVEAVCQYEGYGYVISELLDGNADSLLRTYFWTFDDDKNGWVAHEDRIVRVFTELLDGIVTLHTKNFGHSDGVLGAAHSDIKLSNLFFKRKSSEGVQKEIETYKLGDYDTVTHQESGYLGWRTFEQLSPEGLKNDGDVSFRANDVWGACASLVVLIRDPWMRTTMNDLEVINNLDEEENENENEDDSNDENEDDSSDESDDWLLQPYLPYFNTGAFLRHLVTFDVDYDTQTRIQAHLRTPSKEAAEFLDSCFVPQEQRPTITALRKAWARFTPAHQPQPASLFAETGPLQFKQYRGYTGYLKDISK